MARKNKKTITPSTPDEPVTVPETPADTSEPQTPPEEPTEQPIGFIDDNTPVGRQFLMIRGQTATYYGITENGDLIISGLDDDVNEPGYYGPDEWNEDYACDVYSFADPAPIDEADTPEPEPEPAKSIGRPPFADKCKYCKQPVRVDPRGRVETIVTRPGFIRKKRPLICSGKRQHHYPDISEEMTDPNYTPGEGTTNNG